MAFTLWEAVLGILFGSLFVALDSRGMRSLRDFLLVYLFTVVYFGIGLIVGTAILYGIVRIIMGVLS